jgi:hypothetical protein
VRLVTEHGGDEGGKWTGPKGGAGELQCVGGEASRGGVKTWMLAVGKWRRPRGSMWEGSNWDGGAITRPET